VTSDTSSTKGRLRAIARRAMAERGLIPDFSPAAMAESQAIPDPPPIDSALPDLSGLLWCSIDNDDSRDLDQLSVAEAAADGTIVVRVAVADVDALVPPGRPIDDHARANTTSVYTPAQIFSMLPERLSTNLTSLVQDQSRAAIVVEMHVQEDGIVGGSSLTRALVRNRAKLAYNEVAAWLDGTVPAPALVTAVPGLAACLRLQDRVAHAMRERRQRQGALSLESAEAHAVFDGDQISDLRREQKNRAKNLIEDFMIAANGEAARFLTDRGSPSLRRILKTPKRWSRIVDIAREAGAALPDAPDARALEAFLRERRAADPERFPDLSLAIVKLLGAGEYAVVVPGQTPEGHFGLAVRDYTHSTAPNRRFPDLVTQRLVKAALSGGAAPYSTDDLQAFAAHCTLQENAAEKVERQVSKSAAALLLADRVGQVFSGIVTGASDKGTWVRVVTPPVEGRVVRGQAGLDVGDRVRVQLVATDADRGFIDFARAH
jgi:exoribonuclease-2